MGASPSHVLYHFLNWLELTGPRNPEEAEHDGAFGKRADMKMFIVSENDYTEESIKEELERLYIAAGYINADRGNLEIAMHLIGAAIVELESLAERETRPRIRMVHREKDAAD